MTSPVFRLPHLSEDAVAAFADGVLSAAAASRAQRHCAECVECADAVRGQRETAMMLRTAQAPALPSGLLDRLAGLPMSTPLPPPSRGGLPTVLDADGTAMFIAYDMRKARDAQARDARAGEPLSGEQAEAAAHQPVRHPHRRGALPVTVLASAAAVVAAGTFGGHVSTLAAAADRQAPAGAANVAGSLTGGQNAASNPLTGVATLRGVSSQPPAGPASVIADQPASPRLQRVTSVTLAPVSSAVATTSTPGSAAAGSSRHAAWSTDERPSAAFAPTMASAPVATP